MKSENDTSVNKYGYRLQSYEADGIKGGDNENADIESFTGLIKK